MRAVIAILMAAGLAFAPRALAAGVCATACFNARVFDGKSDTAVRTLQRAGRRQHDRDDHDGVPSPRPADAPCNASSPAVAAR
jgi:hypothetical protein